MSPTMFLGRVILPAMGLLLAAVLSWQAVRSVAAGGAPEIVAAERGRDPVGTPGANPGAIAGMAPASPTPPDPGGVTAEGRVVADSGGEVTVGCEVVGTIIAMPVREKSVVRKGDLLVELRADDVRARIRKARSALVESESEVRSQQEQIRIELLMPNFASRASGTRHDLPAALARRDSAKAEVECLEAELAKYRILAPIDGVVVARHADPGETVGAVAPLITIVDLGRLRVEAEVDEFDIGRVALDAEVTIIAEGYRGRRWRGAVAEIADAVVPRRTRPEDPSRPTDTRILPVKVAFREPTPLKLGQRVEVEIAVPGRER